jgi:hypothetical protein
VTAAPRILPSIPEAPLAETFLPEPSPPPSASVAPAKKDDYAFTLAQIVGTQDQIRLRHLDLESAISLVSERVIEIARAGGAAIALIDGLKVRYKGAAGLMTLPAGTELSMEKTLCVACLRAGQVIRCSNLNAEFLLDVDECHRRGILAIIAVPIYHEGGIAGALEVYYATAQTFTDQDVHTCQLMAGLITEALARQEEVEQKKSLASERAMMLAALEKLKPSLAALVETPATRSSAARSTVTSAASSGASSAPVFLCRKCGHQLVGEEQFCGKCGTSRGNARTAEYQAPSMTSRLASLWHMQETLDKSAVPANGESHPSPLAISDAGGPEKPLADSIEEEMPELFASPELRMGNMPPLHELLADIARNPVEASIPPEIVIPPQAAEVEVQPEAEAEVQNEVQNEIQSETQPEAHAEVQALVQCEVHGEDEKLQPVEEDTGEPAVATALTKPVRAANWSSAIAAREFLEQLAGARRPGALAVFWKARRGDIYLAIAVILVAAVIWGIWSSHSVSATGTPATATAAHRKPAPTPDVSLFDRMLISLGLAEEPPTPEYKGNPDTQVWIDLHTALYYCPGTDLYGKTPKGRYATQRNAQLDQFEPAYRKPCD